MVLMTSTNAHVGDDGAEEIGPHVGDDAHEQPAGAAALRDQLVLAGELVVDQVLRDVDEVVEGVHLLHHLAVVVPRAAHLLAAADVGDGVGEAAVDQAQHAGVEARLRGRAVRAVGVEQQRHAFRPASSRS